MLPLSVHPSQQTKETLHSLVILKTRFQARSATLPPWIPRTGETYVNRVWISLRHNPSTPIKAIHSLPLQTPSHHQIQSGTRRHLRIPSARSRQRGITINKSKAECELLVLLKLGDWGLDVRLVGKRREGSMRKWVVRLGGKGFWGRRSERVFVDLMLRGGSWDTRLLYFEHIHAGITTSFCF